jgi:hypothetical protein
LKKRGYHQDNHSSHNLNPEWRGLRPRDAAAVGHDDNPPKLGRACRMGVNSIITSCKPLWPPYLAPFEATGWSYTHADMHGPGGAGGQPGGGLGAWEGCPSMQQHPCSNTTSAITQQPLPSAPRRRTSLLSIGNALVSRVCGRSANPRPMGRMPRGGTSRGSAPRPNSTQQRAWAGNLRRGPETRVMAQGFQGFWGRPEASAGSHP